MFVLKNLHKSYGHQKVVQQVNFSLEQGGLCAIVGASGSGKSTLLYLMAGLENADLGEIYYEDINFTRLDINQKAQFRNSHIGLIFQFHFLLPSMSALDNILLPSRISNQKISLSLVKKKIFDLAQELGIEKLLNKYPYQLSGGEQQRVNILRAISRDPKIILCDEPTGNLDSQNSQKVVKLLMSLAKTKNTALIFVTHDQSLAMNFSQGYTMQDGYLSKGVNLGPATQNPYF